MNGQRRIGSLSEINDARCGWGYEPAVWMTMAAYIIVAGTGQATLVGKDVEQEQGLSGK